MTTQTIKELTCVIGISYSTFNIMIQKEMFATNQDLFNFIKGQSVFTHSNFDTALTFSFGYCLEHTLLNATIAKCEIKDNRVQSIPTIYSMSIKGEIEKWKEKYEK